MKVQAKFGETYIYECAHGKRCRTTAAKDIAFAMFFRRSETIFQPGVNVKIKFYHVT